MSRDYLKVLVDGLLLDATLTTISIPACEFGAAHKKHYYELDGRQISYGLTKREALEQLIIVSRERGWEVYQKLS